MFFFMSMYFVQLRILLQTGAPVLADIFLFCMNATPPRGGSDLAD